MISCARSASATPRIASTSSSWTAWPRSLTAWIAAHFAEDAGFLVFDNADRWQYNAAVEALVLAGFKHVDFYGTRPILVDERRTSILARSFNWAAANMTIPRGRKSDLSW